MECEDERYCKICNKYTRQLCYDSGHERDSSHDWQECLECGGRYSGYTGKWTPKRGNDGCSVPTGHGGRDS